jgi:hypothetical protein
MSQRLSGKRLALKSPAERLCHRAVKVLDKGQHFGFKISDGSEEAAFEQFASENAEPNLNLVHPGSVLGRVVKDNAMGGVSEKGSTALHGGQNARFPFDPQVDVQIRLLGDVADERFRLMGVEIVHDEMPLHAVGISVNGALDMSEKIGLITSRAIRNLSHPAIGDMEVDDEGQRTVPDVLKLPAQHSSWLHGQVRVLGFECLHARHFICAHNRFSSFNPLLSGLIQLIDVSHLLRRLWIGFRVR